MIALVWVSEMGHGDIPGVCGGPPGVNGASDGSNMGLSNLLRTGLRNGNKQEGSFPEF